MEGEAIPAQIVVAGHICLDIIPKLEKPVRPEPGQLVRIGPAAVSTGGCVANTGLALHRLGLQVRLMGKVGDDAFGGAILDILRTHSPSLAGEMIVARGGSTSYSIVISPPGIDRSFMHCPGANDTFSAVDVRYDRLAGARLFHFGYPPLMRRMWIDGGLELRSLFQRVREMGLATSLDMAQPDVTSEAGKADWEEMLGRVLPEVDVFLPSIEELLFMLDRATFGRLAAGEPQERVIDGAILRRLGERLIKMGVAVAAIKLGERGLYVRTAGSQRIDGFCRRLGLDSSAWQGREVYSPCFRVNEVAGTTGAGDCTIAGFLASMLRRESPAEAATSATAVGACSVEATDATGGVPEWETVRKRMRAGWERLPADIQWGPEITAVPTENSTFELLSRKKS